MGEFDRPWHRLLILVITGASLFTTINGQFTFTGFPSAKKGSRHTVTCSYPGATSYKWRSKGGTTNGAVYTFTVDSAKHQGVWECDAVVNGVTKTGKQYLSIYCDGVYVTSATTTNPSIGDPIDLSCKVLSPSGNRVQWSMVVPGSNSTRKAIASVSNTGCEYYHTENDNIKFAPSTTCRPSTSNQFFNLNIKKVSTAHEGYWTCYDFGKSGCYSKLLRIAIAKPPKDPPTLTGFDNPVLGTNHSLTCNAWQLDVRPLTYTWYKDGVQISSGNTSTWRLQPVKMEANGRYKCEVVDKVKNLRAEAEDTLRVHYVASWNPATKQKEANPVWIGRGVNLTLNILAYPLPTVEWFMEEDNTTTPLNVTTIKISDTTWILNISSVQENDYGSYLANVTNAAGSVVFKFRILPASPPEAPSDLKALQLKDNIALAVTFKIGPDGGAPQNFTIEYNVKGEEKMEYIKGIKDPIEPKTVTQEITNLRSDTLYQIKVKAINDIGPSNYSDVIEAKTEAAGMPVWQVVVITLVVLVLLIAIFLVIFFVVRKKRKEEPEDAKGRRRKKRPASPFVPAGVDLVETTDEGVENPIMVIIDDTELEKIEPVEDIPVSRRFYHELNERAKTREARKSTASPFVKSELAPVAADTEEANGGNASHEYSMVDFRNKTKHKNQENDRQSKVASKLYAAVDFAKKRFRKDSTDEKTDSKQKTPPNVGVDGTLYAEVTLARNRPPTGNKPKARSKRKPEEQSPYGQVDFDRSAPKVETDEFEMI